MKSFNKQSVLEITYLLKDTPVLFPGWFCHRHQKPMEWKFCLVVGKYNSKSKS